MRKFSKKNLWQGKFLKVIGKEFYNKNGSKEIWECIERVGSRGIVAIFAITKNKELILAKQFRFPIENYIVELPAGLLDKEGESPKEAAKRELLEETGYKAEKLIYINVGYFNAGMNNSKIINYYAPDVIYLGFNNIKSDDSEEIEVVKVPIKKLVNFCLKKYKNFEVDLKILNIYKILEAKKLIK
ncbi:MAG: NUDIX hydrolase [Patescibacteria group bacterium]